MISFVKSSELSDGNWQELQEHPVGIIQTPVQAQTPVRRLTPSAMGRGLIQALIRSPGQCPSATLAMNPARSHQSAMLSNNRPSPSPERRAPLPLPTNNNPSPALSHAPCPVPGSRLPQAAQFASDAVFSEDSDATPSVAAEYEPRSSSDDDSSSGSSSPPPPPPRSPPTRAKPPNRPNTGQGDTHVPSKGVQQRANRFLQPTPLPDRALHAHGDELDAEPTSTSSGLATAEASQSMELLELLGASKHEDDALDADHKPGEVLMHQGAKKQGVPSISKPAGGKNARAATSGSGSIITNRSSSSDELPLHTQTGGTQGRTSPDITDDESTPIQRAG
ncbi:hypothetical protein BDW74DRAFT_143534 [Aspergillus multicolor]|uniref:uncharacterized protein n=1 Tax=Aspergillus multicolor TaxID=41759 RepID=UPI003CCE2D7D